MDNLCSRCQHLASKCISSVISYTFMRTGEKSERMVSFSDTVEIYYVEESEQKHMIKLKVSPPCSVNSNNSVAKQEWRSSYDKSDVKKYVTTRHSMAISSSSVPPPLHDYLPISQGMQQWKEEPIPFLPPEVCCRHSRDNLSQLQPKVTESRSSSLISLKNEFHHLPFPHIQTTSLSTSTGTRRQSNNKDRAPSIPVRRG